MSRLSLLLLLLLASRLFAAPALAQFDSADAAGQSGALRLLRITPSGDDVPVGRQIVFQFDRPVVPLGRMAREASEIPITVDPEPGCEWRWIDPAALVCQLGDEETLRHATRYRVRVEPGIETVDGVGMAEAVSRSFITERPKIVYSWFETWKSPGTPVIRLTFNQDVTPDSLRKHLYFAHGDERIPADIEEDGGRHNTFSLSPKRELPLGVRITFRVEPGIRSAAGPEASVDTQDALSFRTFPEFRFLGVRCTTIRRRTMDLAVEGAEETPRERCDPLAPVSLLFNAPVLQEVLGGNLRVEPDLAGDREDYDPWEGYGSYSQLGQPVHDDGIYPVPLPQGLLAFKDYALRAPADAIRDEFNRPLPADLVFDLHTDHRAPALHLSHPISVLEKEVETHLPVVVTNLDEVALAYQELTIRGAKTKTQSVVIDEAKDIAYRRPLEVREWLAGSSGAVVGHMTPTPATGEGPYWFFSEVTPFHVHTKLGHYNTTVWVTDLATGEVVSDAEVTAYIHPFNTLETRPKVLSRGVTDSQGLATLAGLNELDPSVEIVGWWKRRWEDHLFIRVQKGEQLALVPVAQDFAVSPRGANRRWIPTHTRPKDGHLTAWGATAQGVYRAGETVQYKLYVRNRGNERLEAAARGPYTLEIVDPTSKVIHKIETLELTEFGSHAGEFTPPVSGAVGWYQLKLTADFAKQELWPLRVLVSDFTPAPFRVSSELSGELVQPGDEVRVETQASLHAGGPYGSAESRVTARLRPTPIRPVDANATGFRFATTSPETLLSHRSEDALDAQGRLETRFTLSESHILHGSLEIESAVRDDRGKYVSGRKNARFAGRDRYVGLFQDDWVLKAGTPTIVKTIVVDEHGNNAEGTAVRVSIERMVTTASRVKGAGNAYVTQFSHEWVAVSDCDTVSTLEPVACDFVPSGPGSHRLRAAIVDTQQRPMESEIFRWAQGKGRVLWEEPPGHHLEILPEKDELSVGESARYLIKNPYPGAQALVTIERYGVQKSWLETLEGNTPILEFEVEPDFLPGFYLSVVVASARVETPSAAALADGAVDLGKPAFRMGYAVTAVRDPYKELKIEVRPERETYKPRERVVVDLLAGTQRGERVEMELAVAVLDEAVFDLIPQGRLAYDPYRGLYKLDPLDLGNYNLLTRLIGVQKFEKKGSNPGGGGGGSELRSNFRYVSYWNPSVKPDAEGRARIEFEVPDNLTGWRVLVFGATTADQLGLGDASFAVNQPTEIRPALPNQVIEGDRFTARFTVMNRTTEARQLEVNLVASGAVAKASEARRTVRAEPYKRVEVELPVTVGSAGEIVFEVRAGDESDADGVRQQVAVHKKTSFEVAASYGTTTSDGVTETIEFPSDMRGDVGRLSVVTSASVIGNVDGAFRYMADYPYACWEQRLSKGVMASHYQKLRDYLPDDLEWNQAAALPQATLGQAANFQAPNGGMVYWIPTDRHVSPYLSAYTALAFRWLEEAGHTVPPAVDAKLRDYLLTLLRKDAFPTFYSKGMASSVRAVALAALAPTGAVDVSDMRRYRRHFPGMDLFGKAWYLRALDSFPETASLQAEVRDAILAHANQSGGKFIFSEQLDDGYNRLLHTPLRSNCSILSTFTALDPELAKVAGDAPFKLVRTITQTRGQRNHWENTQENLFCMNALIEYSALYESTTPNFEVAVSLAEEAIGQASFRDLRDPSQELGRPLRKNDPGRQQELSIERSGEGRLYYATRLFYSPVELPSERANAGIEVRREYSVKRKERWQKLESPMRIERGELVRVDLYVSLPTARNFVVVDDPVPGGLEAVNRDLATASTVDADEAVDRFPRDAYYFRYDDWQSYASSYWSFYHRELRHDSARFYSDYLPAGNYHLSYVAQAIAPGDFTVLPLRAEEMYDPDIYGRGLPDTLQVKAPTR